MTKQMESDSIHEIIIGAGLAGLAAAISIKVANPTHSVTILEGVRELAEAGLQLAPNGTRLFKPWGIHDRLVPKATIQNNLTVCRYDGTKILAQSPNFRAEIDERYGAPFVGMHRVDLQLAMADRCKELGVVLRHSTKVAKVDFEKVEVETAGGEIVKGDVVICADGLWSTARSQFLGYESKALLTGDLAYRIVIKTDEPTGPYEEMLREWIEAKQVNFRIGSKTHAVAYTIRDKSMFNIVLLCPDDLPLEVSKSEGDVDEMMALFKDWDPILRKFLEQVKVVAKWKLMHLELLPEWINKEGTFMMLGDCCHPMLPYLGMGPNSSLEDGAVLGYLLGKVGKKTKGEQLPEVARLYQELRKERGELLRKETFKQRDAFHMEDGKGQIERDRYMEECLKDGAPKAGFPSRWTYPRVQKWMYGYDAYAEVHAAWEKEQLTKGMSSVSI